MLKVAVILRALFHLFPYSSHIWAIKLLPRSLNCSHWFTFFGFSCTLPSVQSAFSPHSSGPWGICCLAKLNWIIMSSMKLFVIYTSGRTDHLLTLLCSNAPPRCLDHIHDSTFWHMANCVFISTRLWTPLVKDPLCFITVEIVLSIVLALRYINHISIKLFKMFFNKILKMMEGWMNERINQWINVYLKRLVLFILLQHCKCFKVSVKNKK